MNTKIDKSSELTQILNNKTNTMIKWCTPSIEGKSSRVTNIYESDISISYERIGFPSVPSGIFKAAFDKAAHVYGAHYTLFSVNGSTGSNFIVLKALKKQIPNLRILAQRNVHKSVVFACEDYAINLIFMPPNIDEKLQIFFPNSINEIMETIKRTKPQVLLLTNPTYEGIVLDLERLIKKIRTNYPNIILYIEEAWGAHLHFSHKLPLSAMRAGADICIQSTHKQGGSLQQGGMIHWKNERINNDIILESYRSLSTSSPSFTLLASLDAAREMMEKRGQKIIDYSLSISKQLCDGLNSIHEIKVVTLSELKKRNPSVYNMDRTKILIELSKDGITGFDMAKLLEEKYSIIVEKYTHNTILFIIPFHATTNDVKKTIDAIKKIIATHEFKNTIHRDPPRIPNIISKVLEVGDVAKLFWNQLEKVNFSDAEGRISAENITPYPPGIPTTIKGEEFTKELIEYYLKLKDHSNSHILAQDSSLKTVLVVR